MVEVNESVGRPEALAQFLSRDNHSRSFQQDRQNAKWLVLQTQTTSIFAKLTGIKVGFENSETQD